MRLMQMTLFNEGPADVEGELSVEALTDTPVPPSTVPRYTLPARHTPKQVDVFRSTKENSGKESQKRRQYRCKFSEASGCGVAKLTTSTASSGLKLGSDDRAASVATIGVQLNTGARDESEETAGVSQLFAKMAFRATESRS
ncbi:hypothetical protein PC121_g13164 [Phytophthora cactorum]|nr:hypothetical protein PC120_g4101 [Phytophthora cactorum]KAG3061085.1 hypothetical protein PC121_g13164 [Phytophthora cactorum]